MDAASLRVRVAALESDLQRGRRRLAVLEEIGTLLGSTLDLNELLAVVVDRISELVEADRSTLFLLDDDTGELVATVAQGERVHEIRLNMGEGLAGGCARAGRSINVKDAYQDPRFDAEWDRITGYRTRSTLCVPLKNQHGRSIGVVQVLNKRSGYFDPEDEALLSALAAQAATSIENSKLFVSVVGKNIELLEAQEKLRRKIRELDVLFEVAQVAATAMDLDSLLQGMLARSMRAVEAGAAAIMIADRDEADGQGELRFSSRGTSRFVSRRIRVDAESGIAGWVARHQEAQVVNAVESDPRFRGDVARSLDYDAKRLLCVPLRWSEGDGTGHGALQLFDKSEDEPFTEDDVKLATVVAGHVSTAIEQARTRARRERETRLRSLGEFLATVLHDLKAPMTVIGGYSRLLVDEEDRDTRAQYQASIARQVELLKAMTAETLAFARGDRKLWVRKVYLYRFFEELAESLRQSLGERLTIELELRDRGVAYFDAPKMQRAVHNLARNAADAMRVLERGRPGLFRMVVDRAEDGGLVLRFEDDGPGIPREIQSRLFESFATHGKEGGTGLGLAIVRQIVDDHHGNISVETEPGRTCFTFEVPQPGDELRPSELPPPNPTYGEKLPAEGSLRPPKVPTT